MPTQPIEGLLHKPYDNAQLTAVLGSFADAIDETVSFGTHVLKWCVDAATGEPEDAPLLMLLRHELGLADSISLLVRNSSIEPTTLLLRGMFETSLQATYILESDSRRRGLAFVFSHIHDDMKWLDKVDSTSQLGKQFKKAIASDKLTGGMEVPEIPDLQKRKTKIQATISSQKYREVEAEYQRVLISGARRPVSYSLFGGPKDIEQLARHLGHGGMYELLYRPWSGSVHGTDVFRGKVSASPDGKARIMQLRSPKGAEDPTNFALGFCILPFPLFLKRYAPVREKELGYWYRSHIRSLYLKISKDKIIHVYSS